MAQSEGPSNSAKMGVPSKGDQKQMWHRWHLGTSNGSSAPRNDLEEVLVVTCTLICALRDVALSCCDSGVICASPVK